MHYLFHASRSRAACIRFDRTAARGCAPRRAAAQVMGESVVARFAVSGGCAAHYLRVRTWRISTRERRSIKKQTEGNWRRIWAWTGVFEKRRRKAWRRRRRHRRGVSESSMAAKRHLAKNESNMKESENVIETPLLKNERDCPAFPAGGNGIIKQRRQKRINNRKQWRQRASIYANGGGERELAMVAGGLESILSGCGEGGMVAWRRNVSGSRHEREAGAAKR